DDPALVVLGHELVRHGLDGEVEVYPPQAAHEGEAAGQREDAGNVEVVTDRLPGHDHRLAEGDHDDQPEPLGQVAGVHAQDLQPVAEQPRGRQFGHYQRGPV